MKRRPDIDALDEIDRIVVDLQRRIQEARKEHGFKKTQFYRLVMLAQVENDNTSPFSPWTINHIWDFQNTVSDELLLLCADVLVRNYPGHGDVKKMIRRYKEILSGIQYHLWSEAVKCGTVYSARKNLGLSTGQIDRLFNLPEGWEKDEEIEFPYKAASARRAYRKMLEKTG